MWRCGIGVCCLRCFLSILVIWNPTDSSSSFCACFIRLHTPAHRTTGTDMARDRLSFLFLNVGHFLDHLFMLIFATVAALRLAEEWGMSYAALIPYATPGFVAFGICAIPA